MPKQDYNITGDTNKMKSLAKKMADHGTGTDEVFDVDWLPASRNRTLTKERTLIVLEMIYQKAIQGKGSLGAGIAYLDRILGRPKEKVTLDGEASVAAKLSDDELIERINKIIKQAQKG